ncbi:16S rRNA (cytosine(1402)-N(4))-methyltransferase RsmH [Oecophyllibacter saccharovorans]|uniref:16S rRNA (cytosine(1402)-N(4))-methyltransferase RsmH n=1 Tax=Oecophyllibacter saccharovorans TaxID=2558360 RepID=UPI00114331B3|nr:16S rRNA (cytosine(1402)-N(4))-methyltransferase RsmH [Oecophyllibacter saccharovorans]QDH15904.1 16S rRNA (cytosine(1402)-N(4))-methyltransferase RsmH [Oecophyllibacter saccharovorans]
MPAELQAAEGHFPVMLPEVLSCLNVRDGGRYLDGTFGAGGYSTALLKAADCTVDAIDRDPDAIARGRDISRQAGGRLHLHHGTFGNMAELARDHAPYDGIVLDLGVSSFQLDQGERGFSFRHDGPLDMRMSAEGRSAADLVNEESEETLADILYHYGEERRSRRIARAIVAARAQTPFTTTAQLAELVRRTLPRERPGFDPATRTFQALRIAVNDELGELERALETAPKLLAPGGTFVVVSFHSLEDRLVKQAMKRLAGRQQGASRYVPQLASRSEQPEWSLLQTRPFLPSEEELRLNGRSRSARLRALRRIPVHSATLPLSASAASGSAAPGEVS